MRRCAEHLRLQMAILKIPVGNLSEKRLRDLA
jgi:hypothetical protein